MERRITTHEYLTGEESNRPQELAYGFLREPAAPGFGHQIIVGRIHVALELHVREEGLGRVVESPIDVILDAKHALVVQPDLVFVSNDRAAMCTDRIWGAPDLVVEVISKASRRHDSVIKVKWYQTYGVRECWLVDPVSRQVTVLDFAATDAAAQTFDEAVPLRSRVLPALHLVPRDIFNASR